MKTLHSVFVTLLFGICGIGHVVQSVDTNSIVFNYCFGSNTVLVPIQSAVDLLTIPTFDSGKKTVFYFHGFTENMTSESVKTVRDAYLQRGDHNIVLVDWSVIADNIIYPIPAANTKPELCARPQFRASPSGACLTPRELPEPGSPGDPNLLAALGALAQLPRLLERVVPPEQTFDAAHGYCGMFRFRFWQWGHWLDVCVDDRLACRTGRPARLHCAQPDIFWAALLEKAYAKLYGGYSALRGGSVGRALQDLTGCVVQCVAPGGPLLAGAMPRSTLLLAIVQSDKESKRQCRLRNGLLSDHPYCVTGLAKVRASNTHTLQPSNGVYGYQYPTSTSHYVNAGSAYADHNGYSLQNGVGSMYNGSVCNVDTALVRLRSPWGRGEWGGAWAERSWEWGALPDRDKDLLGARPQHEGEFWMSVDEFCSRFTSVWLAHVGPDDWALEASLHARAPWRASLAVRQWRAGFNAGGGPKYTDTTSTNPQFRVRVPAGAPHGKAHLVVAIAQRYECGFTGAAGAKQLQEIGFALYEVPPGLHRLTAQYVSEQPPLDAAVPQRAREVVTFFALPPGDFIVVAHCAVPHQEAAFLLRIFSSQHTDVWEVNEDNLVIHNMAAQFNATYDGHLEQWRQRLLAKLRSRYPSDITALQLQSILRTHLGGHCRAPLGIGGTLGGTWGLGGPSLELCRGLLALRDPNLGGRLTLSDVPALIALLKFWKAAFKRHATPAIGWSGRACSYRLRALLWAAGATASNKVLEALACRFSKNNTVSLEQYLLALARLHLAHERYHSLDAKAKANPLTLEEMILMTIYS